MSLAGMTFAQVAKLPGVADILPIKARGLFAKALMSERDGNPIEAARQLDEAIAVIDAG